MHETNDIRAMPLTVGRVVDAACRIVERDGLGGLSMRRLGAELGVDPMAVYHHVANKRQLLALVTARTVGHMVPPDPSAAWDDRVRQWATRYWDVVVRHRELTLAGLADPEIAAGGLPSTEPLVAAIVDSGLPSDVVEPTTFIVVDAVHGAALGTGGPGRGGLSDDDDIASMRSLFEVGLDTIVTGIAARARQTGSAMVLDHVQLAMPAGREAEAIAFYEGLLGVPNVPKPEHLAVRGGCWFEEGPLKIHLGVDPDFRPAGRAHPAFLVADVRGLARAVAAAGFEVDDDEPLEGYDRVYVHDPFGNRIELMQQIDPARPSRQA